MSQLVCTDRGDHRRVVLLDQRPDDPLERPKFKVLGPPDAGDVGTLTVDGIVGPRTWTKLLTMWLSGDEPG